jgi:hypothetical protein
MKKTLCVIMVAMVSLGMRCCEQRAVVSVDTHFDAEKLVPIKSVKETAKFAGHFVAYAGKSLSCDGSYVIKDSEDHYYGYLSLNPSPYVRDDGHILSKLLNQNRSNIDTRVASDMNAHYLSEAFLEEKNLRMRKVTPEEMVAIIVGLDKRKARLGYSHPIEIENIRELLCIPISTLDIIGAIRFGRYSERLLEWDQSSEFPELLCCIRKQHPDVLKELFFSKNQGGILHYLGLLKLNGCVGY